MNIDNEIIGTLNEELIRIENVFHMPLVTACDTAPDGLWDFFEDDREKVMSEMGFQDIAIYEDIDDACELVEVLEEHKKGGVLVQFSTPVLREFELDNKGKISSCSFSWSYTHLNFAYGENLEESLRRAIYLQEKFIKRCIDSKKLENESVAI